MTRQLRLALVVAFVTVVAVSVSAQSATLKGAWRVVEFTGADGKVDPKPEPGLYIFTDRHYSIMRVTAARVAYPEKPTDKDKVAAFDPFIANAGTYEVKGNQLMTRPTVAKNPNVMTSKGSTSELRFEGAATVYITGPIGGGKNTVKLQRVE